MGVNDRAQDKKDDKRRASLEKRKYDPTMRGSGEIADWANINHTLVITAIQKVAAHGGAMRFGHSRDGGAFSIGVYDGDDKYTIYERKVEDIEAHLEGIIEAYTR